MPWRDELGRYAKSPSGEKNIEMSEDMGLIDSQENNKIAEIARVVENAFNRLGENNQLALQLDIVQSKLVDPGQGWEAERLRLQVEICQNPQFASDYQLLESRIGAEAAVQLDTCRKNNALLEAQVQYLLQANSTLRADLATSVAEARQVVIAHRNEVPTHKDVMQGEQLHPHLLSLPR